jgi:hypothetical protein
LYYHHHLIGHRHYGASQMCAGETLAAESQNVLFPNCIIFATCIEKIRVRLILNGTFITDALISFSVS